MITLSSERERRTFDRIRRVDDQNERHEERPRFRIEERPDCPRWRGSLSPTLSIDDWHDVTNQRESALLPD
jgi:hypothetical protein